MKEQRKASPTSNIHRVKILDSSATTGAGLTGLDNTSSGLIISTIADNEATATAYTVAGSLVETIATLGTYAAPTATKCRFKEVDATNHPGVYEIQIADARYAVASAKRLIVTISGATNAVETDFEVELGQQVQLDDGAHGGTAATLTLERIIVASTTSNEPAVKFTGNGLASGLRCIGYDGIHAEGLTGYGVHATGQQDGMYLVGNEGYGLDLSGFIDGVYYQDAEMMTKINAEVVDALNVDTYAEPGQGTPAATASLATKIGYLYKNWRNRKTQTGTTFSLMNDDTTTVDQKATVADDGTTASKTEIESGP